MIKRLTKEHFNGFIPNIIDPEIPVILSFYERDTHWRVLLKRIQYTGDDSIFKNWAFTGTYLGKPLCREMELLNFDHFYQYRFNRKKWKFLDDGQVIQFPVFLQFYELLENGSLVAAHTYYDGVSTNGLDKWEFLGWTHRPNTIEDTPLCKFIDD